MKEWADVTDVSLVTGVLAYITGPVASSYELLGRPTFFSQFSLVSFAFMAPLADFLLQHVPLPHLPYYLTHWVPGASPLSNQSTVVGTLVGYLVTIFSIREIIKSRQPKRLQYLFQLHNLLLTSGSALLLTLMAEEILPILWKNGLFYAMCNEGAWTEVRLIYPSTRRFSLGCTCYRDWSFTT